LDAQIFAPAGQLPITRDLQIPIINTLLVVISSIGVRNWFVNPDWTIELNKVIQGVLSGFEVRKPMKPGGRGSFDAPDVPGVVIKRLLRQRLCESLDGNNCRRDRARAHGVSPESISESTLDNFWGL